MRQTKISSFFIFTFFVILSFGFYVQYSAAAAQLKPFLLHQLSVFFIVGAPVFEDSISKQKSTALKNLPSWIIKDSCSFFVFSDVKLSIKLTSFFICFLLLNTSKSSYHAGEDFAKLKALINR